MLGQLWVVLYCLVVGVECFVCCFLGWWFDCAYYILVSWIVLSAGQVLGMVVVVVMGCVFGSFWIGLRVEVWIAQAVLTG